LLFNRNAATLISHDLIRFDGRKFMVISVHMYPVTAILILVLSLSPIVGLAVDLNPAVIQSSGGIILPNSIIESYREDKYDRVLGPIATLHPSTIWSADSAESQSFIGTASNITGAGFYLRKYGAPSGLLHAVLYSHSGVFGSNSTPNAELARSDPVESSTLSSQFSLVIFAFSGDEQVTLEANIPYCIGLEGPTSGSLDDANNIQIGGDGSSLSHGGNWARYRYNQWRDMSDFDMIFYVYGYVFSMSTIHGRVVHSDGSTPFSGANVELVGYSTRTITESDGTYSLIYLPSRSYTLRYEANGYQTVEQTIDTSAGGDFYVDDVLLTATSRVRVYGYVTYVNGSAASDITVSITGDNTYLNTTAIDGLYEFQSVIQGDYQLQISVSGYRQLGVRTVQVYSDTRKDVTLVARAPVGGKIPIPNDGQCYHAAFCSWGDTAAPLPEPGRRDIDRFVSIVGKSLYAAENAGTVDVGEDFWPMREPNSWKPLLDEGYFEVFIFSLNPYLRDYPSDSDTINGPTATEWKIANGTYDAWINTLAQQCKDFECTIMLKIGAEMNGNQGPNGPGSWIADFGATPTAFIAAWRRIVDVFAAAGVTNVDWCISYNFESVGIYDFEDYYPGDDYVDWIGVDYYQISASDDPSAQVTAFYNWAVPKNKPLAVTEWGTNWYNKNIPDADRARYINDFFDDIETRPEFKMIRYHWNSWWRFQDDDPSDYGYMPLASAAYRDKIADERYLAYSY